MLALSRRVLLLVVTNLAIVVLLGVVMRVTGLDYRMGAAGLNLPGLLVFASVIGFAGSFISLALSKTIAKWSTKAQVITQPRTEGERWLVATVGELARRSGIRAPEVAVWPSDDPNAFATGMFRNSALVAVSTGLLARMDRRQVEAVLAHEVAHVANGDMVTLALVQGVVNTFVVFFARVIGFVVDKMVLREERSYGLGYYATVIVSEIFLGILASMIVAAYSRRREYRADAGAAALVGAEPMMSALATLGRVNEPGELPKAMAAFGIRGGGSWMRLFASHPPIEDRIRALAAAQRA
jgi:heat shock protein HtpX